MPKKKVDKDALCPIKITQEMFLIPKNVNMVDRDALCPKNVMSYKYT